MPWLTNRTPRASWCKYSRAEADRQHRRLKRPTLTVSIRLKTNLRACSNHLVMVVAAAEYGHFFGRVRFIVYNKLQVALVRLHCQARGQGKADTASTFKLGMRASATEGGETMPRNVVATKTQRQHGRLTSSV